MKSISLESFQGGTKKIIEEFNLLLEKSDYNLNPFVIGDTLQMPEKYPNDFPVVLRNFLEIVRDEAKEITDMESFEVAFQALDDYDNNNKFIKWLLRYIIVLVEPFRDAAFLREMPNETFQKMADYCFANLIIRNSGKKSIDTSIGDIQQLIILRKIMFRFVEMVIVNNFSYERAFYSIKRMFGLEQEKIQIWGDLVKAYEEKLWRVMMMQKLADMEEKLDFILEQIEK